MNRQENAGGSRFPFRTSVIIKSSELSAYELKNYPKISRIMELRSENFSVESVNHNPNGFFSVQLTKTQTNEKIV